MTDAIVDRLKTGSVTSVYRKGTTIKDRPTRYVVVSEGSNVGTGNANLAQWTVNAHFEKGFGKELNDYTAEARGLLSGVALTDADGVTEVLESSGAVGPMIDINDDGSISREVTFTAPGLVF